MEVWQEWERACVLAENIAPLASYGLSCPTGRVPAGAVSPHQHLWPLCFSSSCFYEGAESGKICFSTEHHRVCHNLGLVYTEWANSWAGMGSFYPCTLACKNSLKKAAVWHSPPPVAVRWGWVQTVLCSSVRLPLLVWLQHSHMCSCGNRSKYSALQFQSCLALAQSKLFVLSLCFVHCC